METVKLRRSSRKVDSGSKDKEFVVRRSTRKVAQIKYVADDDVLDHILGIGADSPLKKDDCVNNISESNESEIEDSCKQERNIPKVLHEDGDKNGIDIFSFKSTKSKSGLMEKAFKNLELNRTTPKSAKRKSAKKKRLSVSIQKERIPESTPYNLRRRVGQRLAKLTAEDEYVSDSDSSESGQSDSDDCAKTPNNSTGPNFELLKSDADANLMAENYFRAHLKKPVTSNNTLRSLGKVDFESLQKTLKTVVPTHSSYIEALCVQYNQYFNKWMFQLSEGFNLLFYGLGSKHRLLLDFREKMLAEENVFIINGFFPNITLKYILSQIIEEVFDSHASSNLQEMLNIVRSLVSKNGSLFIIIHNIDGSMLRSEKVQNAICKLAEMDKIKILATIDHINAPLIWDQHKLSQLNWIWHDVTTFIPYTDETTFEHNLLIKPNENIVLSSLIFVFRSLNPKAKKIFLMLARYQIDNNDNPSYIGMSYQDCYRKCRENFLVNSDLTLKTQLTEFKDHKIIKFKKGPDSIEYLLIPLEPNVLSDFVEQNKQ